MAEADHMGQHVSIEDVTFVTRETGELVARYYRPIGEGPFPVVVAVHGGGWRLAPSETYQFLGRFLAAHGFAVLTPTYRLATSGRQSFPAAVHDIRAAVQFVRSSGDVLGIDMERVALMGDSSGGHLAALVALAGNRPPFSGTEANGPLEAWPASVKAAIPVYGIFDLAAQWQHDQAIRFSDHIVERFLGQSLAIDRRLYFDASPLSYVGTESAGTPFLVAWGEADDVVDADSQSKVFVRALKQAGHFVRTIPVLGAPHYWLGDPIDEPGSFSHFLAVRLVRFLQARL